jgi:predicted dehydrogenase
MVTEIRLHTRREFLEQSSTGIAGILAAGAAPAFAQDSGIVKIGQIGLGSHDFLRSFANPPKSFKGKVRCIPYGVWDETPAAAEAILDIGFKKVFRDPEELIRECDAVHFEHGDYRKALSLTRPALEAGKPVFYDRPFAYSIADAEEIVRLAKAHDAAVMTGSSLEFQPIISEISRFAKEMGPLRAYECYCPEPFFPWMFPHVINFAHAALGGGIESAYFSGDFVMDWGNFSVATDSAGQNPKFVDPARPYGSAISLLMYKPREGQPPILGMNHIGGAPGSYHLAVYAQEESKMFVAGDRLNAANIFEPMYLALYDFYANRKPPRPYEAILEQHRALVATNLSRLSGGPVRLDTLGGGDSLPWDDGIRNWFLRYRVKKKGTG